MNTNLFFVQFQKDLKLIENILENSLSKTMKNNHFHYIKYVLDNNGKQFRPLISIIIASSYKNISESDYNLFAAIEMIHIASLLHDDVIDDAELRRGRQTINKKWGNNMAVILGVYAYSNALALLHKYGDIFLIGYFSKIVRRMCEGELYQLDSRMNNDLSLFTYLRIVYCKTACLFSAAFAMGAYVSPISKKQKKIIKRLGLKFGFLYQLIDDVLDISDSKNHLKKPPFQDLKNGQLTLPLIVYMNIAKEKALDIQELQKLSHEAVIKEFKKYKIIELSKNIIHKKVDNINNLCDKLESNKLSTNLKKIQKLILKRV